MFESDVSVSCESFVDEVGEAVDIDRDIGGAGSLSWGECDVYELGSL